MFEQSDGPEPIGRLPELSGLELLAQSVPGIQQKPHPALARFKLFNNHRRLLYFDRLALKDIVGPLRACGEIP